MKVLVATTGNDGHFGPLAPVARACAAAGHEVRVCAPASFARAVTAAGFIHAPFPDAPAELLGPLMAQLVDLSIEEADLIVVRDVFGRLDARAALPGILATVEQWRPDVVVREPAEFGSLAAAERAGLPHVQVAIGVQETTRLVASLTTEPLAELAELVGLSANRLTDAMSAAPQVSTVPESFDRAGDVGYRDDVVTWRVRPSPVPAATDWATTDWAPTNRATTDPDPPPLVGDPDLPLLYVTFGTVTGSLPPFAGVFREALDALADQPVRVLMTVGRRVDPTSLGALPDNASVLSWWSQESALRHATSMLGHGGFGTTVGAMAAGVPQVVAPIFTSDQAANARHVQAVGAGIGVEPGRGSVARGCAQVAALLGDASLTDGAAAAAASLAALPDPASVVAHLEALAT